MIDKRKKAAGRAEKGPPPDFRVVPFKIAQDEYAVLSFAIGRFRASRTLTRAEGEVLAQIVEGKSNAEIARLRGTSPRTVANQVSSIFRKYAVSSRAELVSLLLSHK